MSDDRDLWGGLRPTRPPATLRAHVLAAAWEAAARPSPGLFAALGHDRVLRLCAAGLAALLLANVLIDGGSPRRDAVAIRGAYRADGIPIPDDAGLTAAEQIEELAPILGDAIVRSRG